MPFHISDEAQMQEFIRVHYHYLVTRIRPNTFYPYLISCRVLNSIDKETIDHEHISVDKSGKFLDVIRERGIPAFEAFMKVLEFDFPTIYTKITGKDAQEPPEDWSGSLHSSGSRRSAETFDKILQQLQTIVKDVNTNCSDMTNRIKKMKRESTNFLMEESERVQQLEEEINRYKVEEKEWKKTKEENHQLYKKLHVVKEENSDFERKCVELKAIVHELKKEKEKFESKEQQQRERVKSQADVERKLKQEKEELHTELIRLNSSQKSSNPPQTTTELLSRQKAQYVELEKAHELCKEKLHKLEEDVATYKAEIKTQNERIVELDRDLTDAIAQKKNWEYQYETLGDDYKAITNQFNEQFEKQDNAIRKLRSEIEDLEALTTNFRKRTKTHPEEEIRRPLPRIILPSNANASSLYPYSRNMPLPALGSEFMTPCSLNIKGFPSFGSTKPGTGVAKNISLQQVRLNASVLKQVELTGGNYSHIFIKSIPLHLQTECELKAGSQIVTIHPEGSTPIDFTSDIITLEHAVNMISDMEGLLDMDCIYNKQDFDRLSSTHIHRSSVRTSGDCFCISVHGETLPSPDECLSLDSGSVLMVTSTRPLTPDLPSAMWEATHLDPVTGRLEEGASGFIPAPTTSIRSSVRATWVDSLTNPSDAPYAYVKPYICRKRPIVLLSQDSRLADLPDRLATSCKYSLLKLEPRNESQQDLTSLVMQVQILHFHLPPSSTPSASPVPLSPFSPADPPWPNGGGHKSRGTSSSSIDSVDPSQCSQVITTDHLVSMMREASGSVLLPILENCQSLPLLRRLLLLQIYPIIIVVNISGNEEKLILDLRQDPFIHSHYLCILNVTEEDVRDNLDTVVSMVNQAIRDRENGIVWVTQDNPVLPFIDPKQ